MARITVVGDGPAGLSAALLLAKAGHQVAVHGDDKTAMHYAMVRNYLGTPDVPGSDFQRERAPRWPKPAPRSADGGSPRSPRQRTGSSSPSTMRRPTSPTI